MTNLSHIHRTTQVHIYQCFEFFHNDQKALFFTFFKIANI